MCVTIELDEQSLLDVETATNNRDLFGTHSETMVWIDPSDTSNGKRCRLGLDESEESPLFIDSCGGDVRL